MRVAEIQPGDTVIFPVGTEVERESGRSHLSETVEAVVVLIKRPTESDYELYTDEFLVRAQGSDDLRVLRND